MPRPPQTESRSTPSSRAAASRLAPSANSPRLPDGVKTTRWALNVNARTRTARAWSTRDFAPIVLGEKGQGGGFVSPPQPLGGGRGLLFQTVAALGRRAAPPLGEIGVVALRAGVHRRRVNGADEALRQFALRRRTSGLDDDLARDVAPIKNGQAGHGASLRFCRVVEEGSDALEAGEAALKGEAEAVGCGLRLRGKLRVVELRQMDDAPVGAEIIVAQLREAVEAEPADDERVEMADEKIGEVERAGLFLAEAREGLVASIERVAMGAVDAPHALFLEHAIKLAAGPAIAVEAEDLVIRRAIGADLRPHLIGNAPGMIVQLRRQAGDIDVIEPERQNLAGER